MIVKIFELGMIGENAYLAYDETKKGFLVDPGLYSQKIEETVKEEEIEIEYIILTHGHADHMGGVEAFKQLYPNAKVVAHEDEKEMLHDPALNFSTEMYRKSISIDADIYVKDGDKLTVGNTELLFIHTPGHSEGGMCIVSGKVCFSGDTLFRASIGRTDFPCGNFEKLISSIKKKLFMLADDTVVYPGHMGATTIEFEKRHNPFV